MVQPILLKSKGGFGGGARRSGYQSAILSSGPPAPMMARAQSMMYAEGGGAEAFEHRGLEVSSRGNVTATFSVPGLMSIPSDNVAHNVTIVKLSLDATMEWVTVPKREVKVHLKVCVRSLTPLPVLISVLGCRQECV